MKIRLEEYSRGARVRLSVDDAPMTAIHALVNHFVMACTDLSEKQHAEPETQRPLAWALGNHAGPAHPTSEAPEIDPVAVEDAAQEAHDERAEPPKKRGRPKKVETVAAAPEPAAAVEEAAEEPGLPFAGQNTLGALPEAEPSSDTATEPLTDTTSSEPSTEPSTPPADDPEITDSELQRYCAKLAQHFGTPQTVFDLAGKFVPDGAVARPTNIRDNGQRWAFVRAAEEQSGVKYHG